MTIAGTTTIAGLVGGPRQVELSFSPRIQNAAFAAAGLDWAYCGFPVEEGQVGTAVRGLAAAGVRGLNVTMPHKREAAGAVDRLKGAAARTLSVNTIAVENSEITGWNTDGDGLIAFLTQDAGVVVAGLEILVLGSGGSARPLVAALAGAGASGITVAARRRSEAAALAELAGEVPFYVAGWDEAGPAATSCGLMINASPVGQEDEELPVRVAELTERTVVLDLIYRPESTRFVREARAAGLKAFGGLGMLVRQGALSFEIWTGVPAPVEAMKAAAGLP